ncbi:unnamed protein product [Rangifer tarandus platyrhynchus]|uniref:Uncharacterized protein n=2 Tax=Rangifer tarandus platyrhynchus TaxID=3082113 RepID=A0ABN8ZDQ5_RANTA|nr:unnamed protein product [Rangifer tarandus platyrhynchus]CAI9707940.1 unnamed protein product [Rangifer tarandus platyrhynchus]
MQLPSSGFSTRNLCNCQELGTGSMCMNKPSTQRKRRRAEWYQLPKRSLGVLLWTKLISDEAGLREVSASADSGPERSPLSAAGEEEHPPQQREGGSGPGVNPGESAQSFGEGGKPSWHLPALEQGWARVLCPKKRKEASWANPPLPSAVRHVILQS